MVIQVTAQFHPAGASETRPKHWVLKLDEDTARLGKEIENYNRVLRTPAKRLHIPRLLLPDVISVQGLGGIVFEFESGTRTLMEHMAGKSGAKSAVKIATQLGSMLEEIYGNRVGSLQPLNGQYGLYPATKVALRSFLESSRQIFIECLGDDCFQDNERLLQYQLDELGSRTEELDTRFIHGDLNARNLLIDENSDLRLIDFASMDQKHIAHDIAKLERDVILRIMDSGTLANYDWRSLPRWARTLELVTSPEGVFAPSAEVGNDGEDQVNAAMVFVRLLRCELKRISPETTSRVYLHSLLFYSLISLAHPEISLPKKALAMQYSATIIRAFRPELKVAG